MLMQRIKILQIDGAPTLKGAIWFFILFYSVGVAGLLYPLTFPLFVKLIPFALMLSLIALFIFHQNFKLNRIILFIIVFVLSFVIEVIGVKTGSIFGSYHYGDSLGPKLYDTPLMIGLNWVLLVYLTYSSIERFKISVPLKVIIGASLMLLYDILLEQVAPVLDMWQWEYNRVPLQNYATWFILALLFHVMLAGFNTKTGNRLAPYILACQLSFFAALNIAIK